MTQDAKERAIKSFVEEQEWSYMAEMPRGIGESFGAGWDAAKREDEQRIAELDKRALLREWRSGKYALWRDDPAAIAGFSAGVDAALRALGQSEEMKP